MSRGPLTNVCSNVEQSFIKSIFSTTHVYELMNAIIFQSIDHLSFWCIINQENGSHMAATCFKWRSPNFQTVQTTKIISNIKEKRKETCCLQQATGSVSLDLGPNEREVKNFHFLPAIIATATFIPKRFSSRRSAQPVIDSEMSACPQNPVTISSPFFPPFWQ